MTIALALLALACPPAATGAPNTCAPPQVAVIPACNWQCRWRAHRRRVIRPVRAYLLRIARCESGGRWHIATGNGFYGGLQFTLSSWRAVGGRGYPHWATPLEQMFRAVKLARVQGWGAWPVCRYA